jgi:CrcB protein
MIKQYAAVFLGAGIGAVCRWRLSDLTASFSFPVGTLAANLIGCFVLGLAVSQMRPDSAVWLFVAVGFCGALTTFSTLVFDLSRLSPGSSTAYLVISLGLGAGLFFAGRALAG